MQQHSIASTKRQTGDSQIEKKTIDKRPLHSQKQKLTPANEIVIMLNQSITQTLSVANRYNHYVLG